MANKFYTVEKEIRGKSYTAQFNGITAALKAVDSCYIEGTSNTSVEKFNQYLLDNVIVQPKGLTVDDFESVSELNEVAGFAREVMQGDLKPDRARKDDAKEK